MVPDSEEEEDEEAMSVYSTTTRTVPVKIFHMIKIPLKTTSRQTHEEGAANQWSWL
jgi:hypothetical protein